MCREIRCKKTFKKVCMKHFKLFILALLFVFVFQMNINAQTTLPSHFVEGVVTDNINNETLVSVSVYVKGNQSTATVTDLYGKFKIKANKGEILVFSYLGFKTTEVMIEDTSKALDIVLLEDAVGLEELVVVGFGVQKKVNLSGAVATVSTKQLQDRPVVNIGQALQGTVGNLNVTVGNGRADAAPTYNIRGHNSLNDNAGPMIVIDGIVADAGALNNLNPNDIENISVLKDAASAAIYGSRASFGVILVSTKTGKSEKIQVTYNNNFVFKSPTFRPSIVKDPYLNMYYLNQMGSFQFPQIALDYAQKVNADPSLPKYLEINGSWTYFGSTNWYDEMFNSSAFSTQHSLELSGKSKRTNYLLSANYFMDDGILKPASEKYDRYNFRSKVSYEVSDRLIIGNNTSYMRNKYKRPSAFGDGFLFYAQTMGTYEVVRNPEGGWSSAGVQSVADLVEGGRAETLNNAFQTKFDARFDILKNVLFVNGNFAYSYDVENYKTADFPLAYKRGPELAYIRKSQSSAEKVSRPKQQVYTDAYITFDKVFNKKHAVTAVAGYSQETYRSEYQWYKRTDLISNSLPTPQLGTGTISINESVSKWAMRSGFARLNYILDNKYIAEFNGRYDGSSRFPKGHRYVFNPSGSVAWIASSENFFAPIKSVVSHLKLRASYGQLANQSVSNFGYLPTMSTKKTGVLLDGENPMTITTAGLVSGDFTWEKSITKNLGVDINFLNDRLAFSGDIYVRDTKDMLTKAKTYPGVLGAAAPRVNAADLRTRGWELSVAWRDNVTLAGKPMDYGVTFVLSDNQSKVTKYDNESGNLNDFYVGKRLGEIWGLETEGYFGNEAEIKNHADQSSVMVSDARPGDLKFKDQDGDHVISKGSWTLDNPGDYKVIGNSAPRYNFGLNMYANWNNIDFGAFFQGVGKRQFYPTTSGMNVDYEFFSYFATQWTHLTPHLLNNHWTEENRNTFYPRLKEGAAGTEGKEMAITQTKYLLNGAYLRLKNVTIGYSLPKSVLDKVNLERVRVFFSGENLCTWSKLPSFYKVDPELAGRSGNGGGIAYSLQKSYSFGLNVTF